MLSGGVSALLAEAMASLGAYIASGYKRVAGVQLAINHFRPTLLGELVEAEARPIQRGRSIQVHTRIKMYIDKFFTLNSDQFVTA